MSNFKIVISGPKHANTYHDPATKADGSDMFHDCSDSPQTRDINNLIINLY